MSTVKNQSPTFNLLPPGFFVKKEAVEALKNCTDLKAAAIARLHLTALYALDTLYYSGKALSSTVQFSLSVFNFAVLILAPENTLLQRGTHELFEKLDGLPALVSNVVKTFICASAVLATPFCSAEGSTKFYLYCQGLAELAIKKNTLPPTKNTLLPLVPRYSELPWIPRPVKEAFDEILSQMENPQLTEELGLDAIPSIILVGPPGNGKTFLTEAFAREVAHRFPDKKVELFPFKMESLTVSFVGRTTENVVAYKEKLEKMCESGCVPILFIDELDTYFIDRKGDNRVKEYEMILTTVMQMIVQLKKSGGLVLAASNHAEKIDKALIRAGRFDKVIHVPNPTLYEGIEILVDSLSKTDAKHLSDRLHPLTPLDQARLLPYLRDLSIAEIKGAVNRARSFAALNRNKICFELLVEKLLTERESREIIPSPFKIKELLRVLEKLLLTLGPDRVSPQIITGALPEEQKALVTFLKGLTIENLITVFEKLPESGEVSIGRVLFELYYFLRDEGKLTWRSMYLRLITPFNF